MNNRFKYKEGIGEYIKKDGTKSTYIMYAPKFKWHPIHTVENESEYRKIKSNNKIYYYKKKYKLQEYYIVQYDKDNNIINKWNSIKEASDALHIASSHICECIKGKLKSTGGFIWKREKIM